jgi:hypothetical protein
VNKRTKPEVVIVDNQLPVIISAARSTDIPAFYSDWLIEKIREGYVKWRNPFNNKLKHISFSNTRLIVFWSKNPKPLLKKLYFFDEIIPNYYFQYTLNDYEKEKFEPEVPDIKKRIETFQSLSEKIGKEKVIWRFDPLILTDKLGVDELLRRVENIGNQLNSYTEKLVFSFADIGSYRKVQRNMRINNINYQEFNLTEMYRFAAGIQEINRKWNLNICTCAEQIPLEDFGIHHNKCIDDDLIIRLFKNDTLLMDALGIKFLPKDTLNPQGKIEKGNAGKDKGQREFCGCIKSKDIGMYNSCLHFCVYCYANTSKEKCLPIAKSTNSI